MSSGIQMAFIIYSCVLMGLKMRRWIERKNVMLMIELMSETSPLNAQLNALLIIVTNSKSMTEWRWRRGFMASEILYLVTILPIAVFSSLAQVKIRIFTGSNKCPDNSAALFSEMRVFVDYSDMNI